MKNGRIKVYYSHWGALEGYEAGKEKIKVPEKEKKEKYFYCKDRFEFGETIDYLYHEAVWLDNICYCPIWIFPSDSVKCEDWKTQGQGILLKSITGDNFNHWDNLDNMKYLIDDLTPELTTKQKIRLMINFVLGNISSKNDDIPDFSPLGNNVKYMNMKKLLKQIKEV